MTSKIKILVAEDSRTQALRLRADLEAHSFDVVLAFNGRQALAAAIRERPDAILSDVLMPDIDGFRLCRELMQDPALCDIPIVLRSSAFLDEEDRNFALVAGAFDYVTKEVEGDDLERILRAAVDQHDIKGIPADLGDENFRGKYESRLLSQLIEKAAHAERMAEDLRQTQQLLQAVMESSPALVAVKDLDGCYLMVNQRYRDVYGVSTEDIQGKTPSYLFQPEDLQKIDINFKKVVETGEAMEFEESFEMPDGTRTWLSTKYPLKDSEDRIYAVSEISLEITERKLLEEQLMQSQKMEGLGRLASGIAHDFNNLLSVIINYTVFAGEGLEEDDPRAADLQEVSGAAQRGAHLVQQLLTYSRGGAAAVEAVDVNEAIREMEGLLQGSLPGTIELVLHPDLDVDAVMINPDQFGQVLLNLIVNARDAMPDGGRISVRTETVRFERPFRLSDCELPPGAYVRVAVSDTGHGMTFETMQRMFDPFFTTKSDSGGTGLGLSTAHGIISGANGCLTVHSELQKGTTFHIYLPIAAVSPSPGDVESGSGVGAPADRTLQGAVTKQGA